MPQHSTPTFSNTGTRVDAKQLYRTCGGDIAIKPVPRIPETSPYRRAAPTSNANCSEYHNAKFPGRPAAPLYPPAGATAAA